METVFSIALGIGLSAACGFRVFLPFLVASVASWIGWLPLSDGFEWLGTIPAMVAFGSATVLEISAFYVPWIDNMLDSIATPAAVIAGFIASASVMADLPPLLKWSIALIGGGGVAGIVQGTTAILRLASTSLTGGAANAVVATVEWILSAVTSLLSVLLPVAGIFFVAIILLVVWLTARRVGAGRKPLAGSSP